MTWREKYADLITLYSREHRVERALVEAMIQVESGGDPWASRFEPQYRYLADWLTGKPWHGSIFEFPHPKGVSRSTEINLQRTSFGLMQIMGGTAREIGFNRKWLTELYDPALNLSYGCRFLRRCMVEKQGSVVQALVRWNGSTEYPPKVFKVMDEWGSRSRPV